MTDMRKEKGRKEKRHLNRKKREKNRGNVMRRGEEKRRQVHKRVCVWVVAHVIIHTGIQSRPQCKG